MTEDQTTEKVNEVWESIENARCNQRFTQKDLTSAAGIAPTVYSEIKNGNRNITLRLAVRLADALGLKICVAKKEEEAKAETEPVRWTA